MVPRTYPSTFAPNGQQQMVVYFLTSVVGLRRWVDYIPVKLSNGGVENSYNNNGFINVAIVPSLGGTVRAWKDYIPVYQDDAATTAWQVSSIGFIPYNYSGFGGASLILDFTNGGALDSRITFTRASTGTYYDSTGVLQSDAINDPRFDYNPTTLAPLGLLIEEQRTNLLLHSEQFNNAGWIKFGTTSVAADTTTSPNGGVNADRVTFGASSGMYQAVASTPTTTYAISIWIRADSAQSVSLISNTDLSEVTTLAVSVTTSWQRVTLQKTTTTGTTVNLQLTTAGSGATVYLWGAQLEAGAFATSYIPTTTAAATRAADVASITGTNFSSWYNVNQGTMYASIGSAPVNNLAQFAWELNDNLGGGLGRIFTRRAASSVVAMAVISGGVTQLDIFNPTVVPASATYKVACAFQTNNFALSLNGATVVTSSSGTSISTISALFIGQNNASTQSVNGYIRFIAYYPRRLSNAELQSITV